MVQEVNCRTVAVVPYAAGIVEWTKEELLIISWIGKSING